MDVKFPNRNTCKASAYAAHRFRVFLKAQEESAEFEKFSKEKLAMQLRTFYVNGKKLDGSSYGGSSLISLRAGLKRYIEALPEALDIVFDPAFAQANKALKRQLQQARQTMIRPNKSTRFRTMTEDDIRQLYSCATVFNIDDPEGLLRKVFFEVMLMGCQLLLNSTIGYTFPKSHFSISEDEFGKRYISCECVEDTPWCHLYETGTPFCPVESFMKLLKRCNPRCDSLFQHPFFQTGKGKHKVDSDGNKTSCQSWYKNMPMGQKALSTLLQEMARIASLKPSFSRKSVRAFVRNATNGHIDINDILKRCTSQIIPAAWFEPTFQVSSKGVLVHCQGNDDQQSQNNPGVNTTDLVNKNIPASGQGMLLPSMDNENNQINHKSSDDLGNEGKLPMLLPMSIFHKLNELRSICSENGIQIGVPTLSALRPKVCDGQSSQLSKANVLTTSNDVGDFGTSTAVKDVGHNGQNVNSPVEDNQPEELASLLSQISQVSKANVLTSYLGDFSTSTAVEDVSHNGQYGNSPVEDNQPEEPASLLSHVLKEIKAAPFPCDVSSQSSSSAHPTSSEDVIHINDSSSDTSLADLTSDLIENSKNYTDVLQLPLCDLSMKRKGNESDSGLAFTSPELNKVKHSSSRSQEKVKKTKCVMTLSDNDILPSKKKELKAITITFPDISLKDSPGPKTSDDDVHPTLSPAELDACELLSTNSAGESGKSIKIEKCWSLAPKPRRCEEIRYNNGVPFKVIKVHIPQKSPARGLLTTLSKIVPERLSYSSLKENCKNFGDFHFIRSDLITYCKFYHTIGGPVVQTSLTVNRMYHPTVYVHGKQVAPGHEVYVGQPEFFCANSVIEQFLKHLGQFKVCPGNPEPYLQETFTPSKLSAALSCKQCLLYTDNYQTLDYTSTLRTTACQLLVRSDKKKCDNCRNVEYPLQLLFTTNS